MAIDTPNGKIKTTEKNIKNFTELETISNEQQLLVVDEENNGKKITSKNLKTQLVSADSDNIVTQSTTDSSLYINDKVGDLDNLTTVTKKNAVLAINEIIDTDNKIGNVSTGETAVTITNSIHSAYMNEMGARVDADEDLQEQINNLDPISDIRDIVGTYSDLNNYDTSKLDNDDIVKVLKDETKQNASTYYKWDELTKSFLYTGKDENRYSKEEADDTFVLPTRKIQEKSLENNIVLALNELTDININNPILDNILMYNISGWTNTPIPVLEKIWGEVAGTLENQKDLYNLLKRKTDKSVVIVSSSKNHILFESGILIQWGKETRSSATQTVTLPYSYVSASYALKIQAYHTTASVNGYQPLSYEGTKTATSFTANVYTKYTGFYWVTVGQGVVS